MDKKINQPVPVLMYHSVGIPNNRWNWNYLTCPFELFENQLRTLKKNGYKSIGLPDLYNYIFYSAPIPKKSIVFTFDDGYLDNWVFAYPLMKKYGFQGTIYVNPEFVDPNPVKRKRMDEVTDVNSLESIGFLSWEEMRQMENDNVMSIESHALTHTWYPISDKIIDYRHPGDKYIWMTWNSHIHKKHSLQIDDENIIDLGEPVYENGKSLLVKRFFPDERLKRNICDFVSERGGKTFFEKSKWKEELDEEVRKYKSIHPLIERFETDIEYKERILLELQTTKSIISAKLNKTVDFHCWPGGSATKIGMVISDSLGFKLSNVADDIKEIRYKIKNNNLFLVNRINRFVPLIYAESNGNHKVKYSRGILLLFQIMTFTQNRYLAFVFKSLLFLYKHIYRLFYKLRNR
jgi:hypothetical protein